MPVYVDSMFIEVKVGRLRARWCHLIADTEEELHAMAATIGLRRGWFQQGHGMPHYDVTEKRRAAAVATGAIELRRDEFVAKLQAYRKS